MTRLLTLKDTQQQLRLGKSKIRNLVDCGHLTVIRFGRAIRVHADEVERLAREGVRDGED